MPMRITFPTRSERIGALRIHDTGRIIELDSAGNDLPSAASVDHTYVPALTLEAMHRGEKVVVGGRLPLDVAGRRVGEPDILVRVGLAPVDGRWRYAPVDVKTHGILRSGKGHDVIVQHRDHLVAPTGTVEEEGATPDGRRDRTARNDTLQLAHYHRMLEACGHAAAGPAWGAILGAEGWVAWFPLDEPLWMTPTNDPDQATKRRSALDVYDFEFAFRLDIAAVAGQHQCDPSVPLLVAPMDCGECAECPWRNHCWPQLDESGDVSRLPSVNYAGWRALREAGLGTNDLLAAAPDDAVVDGLPPSKLRELRLQARARVSDVAVHTRGDHSPPVPRADVEVDVDMENIADGAYLWGATVTVRGSVAGIERGHHAFVTWTSPLDAEALAQNFDEFWTWLSGIRQACVEQDASFLAFCWSASAENRFLREGAALLGNQDEVEHFIASEQWLDLLAWFRGHFVTGSGMGLKQVATRLGFAWRDEDPGGAASITWYREATDPEVSAAQREAARDRLLAYNEDDVRATLAVREVLSAGVWSPPPAP